MLQSPLHAAIGVLPRWLVPLLFPPALILGREEAALVAHSAGWTSLTAVVMALVSYICYVLLLVRLSHRWSRMRRIIDRLSASKWVAWLLRHIEAGPLWWQCAKVAILGFLPAIGFNAGVLWARRGAGRYQSVRMSAVVVGATASYFGYHSAIGVILALPLALGAGIVGGIVALAVSYHQRERLRPLGSWALRRYQALGRAA